MHRQGCLLFAALTVVSSLPAIAAPASQQAYQNYMSQRSRLYQQDTGIGRAINENKAVSESKQVPDLPYLPPYNGFKPVVNSVLTYKRQQGQGFTICYETAEPPEQVIEFYKSAFRQNRWDPQAQSNPYMMTATKLKEGVMCTVSAAPSSEKNRRCRLHIGYSFTTPVDQGQITPSAQQPAQQQQQRQPQQQSQYR